jgi:hypothetical protein
MNDEQYYELLNKLRELGDKTDPVRARQENPEAEKARFSQRLALEWMAHDQNWGERLVSVQDVLDSKRANKFVNRPDRAAIIGLFKKLEALGLGQYHGSAGDGPTKAMEFYASSRDVARAALGYPHVLDVVRPGEEIPDHGPERDQHVATRLRRWMRVNSYSHKYLLTWHANHPHMSEGTPISKAARITDSSQGVARLLFEDLEEIGVGAYVPKRDGKPAHFEWYASSQEVGKAARGMEHNLQITGPGFDRTEAGREEILKRHSGEIADEVGVDNDQVEITIKP